MRFLSDTTGPDRRALGPQMRVIGAGLPRCATSSLQAALESPHLGFFPCMHMAHVMPSNERAEIVLKAMQERDKEKRQALLHKIFDGYQATTDFPGFWFLDDLMDMYPDALLVLNQRKGGDKSWLQSWNSSIAFFRTWTYLLLCLPVKNDRLHWLLHREAKNQITERWRTNDLDGFYDVYQKQVLDEAKRRNRKILVWTAEDGWGPLCEFLGKDVPKDEPFPWVNDAATMKLIQRILVARGLASWLAIFGSVYAAWKYGPSLLQSRLVQGLWRQARQLL
ncbi:uncharacterized protein Triagg1_9487 [Trichoderma aggressivum f. europaeum]|uniref:Tpr repeat containing protein n=1 Tax=Trichoderma aggressivum f. europaeum TaxID=173218 RepID=A0AAE1IAG6_9HYPO|nr:hypothetical protein Triagg1_9487 [Trichoderma aggressivum f. europaeum]